MANLLLPFGASAPRRVPTADELANGYGCGEADLELFNWMAWHLTGQIGTVVTNVGLANDDADLARLDTAIRKLFRTRLQANTAFYVNGSTGNDTTGDGSSGTPWKTLTKAANYLQTQLDLNGFTVTINVANGTYTGAFTLAGFVPGQVGITSIQVVGNVASPTSCFVNSATISPFGASNGAAFQVKGFQVAGSSVVAQNGSGIYASSGGIISYESMAFNTCVFAHVFAENGGYCVASAANTINGNCSTHLYAKNGGTISIAARAHTLQGGPTFTGAFASAEVGIVEAAGATFSGSASGPRYFANLNGVIKTGGGGANFFPGNAAGSVNAGGQYV